jgi:hypothetical protein
MAEDNGNPFDAPLASEIQEHQQAQAATVASSHNGNPFDEPLMSEKAEAAANAQAQNGQVTNDVGNTVIVPKDGESFADTMKRAAAYGKTVTPSQVNAELATAPKKAATVLAAAPAIGFGGAAALAAPGEAVNAGERLLQMTESQLQRFAEAYPHLSKIATHLGISATPVGIYELLTRLGGKK